MLLIVAMLILPVWANAQDYELDPSVSTAGIVSTFKIQPDTYTWKVVDFTTPDHKNLIIYEMLFRDFTSTGDIRGTMAKLDYLETLSVNAIELMPVQEFDGNDSWGYNPCFYFAMGKAYGTKTEYKELIHRRMSPSRYSGYFRRGLQSCYRRPSVRQAVLERKCQ